MIITPQTSIELLNTPLTEDQENQLTFSTLAAQNAYFEGLNPLILEDCTYQRKDNYIRYPGNIDGLYKYNYVRYKNADFADKWFYAFITKLEYVNENMTYIYIKTDVWQTWMFDITLENSFVEREHVDNDYPGAHTIPEGLEYGNYVINSTQDFFFSDRVNTMLCLQVTDFPSNSGVDASTLPARIYNGVPSGCYYICVPSTNYNGIDKWVSAYNKDGKQDAIISIFPLPFEFLGAATWQDATQLTNNIFSPSYVIPYSLSNTHFDVSAIINLPSKIQGYTPKNNKLFTSPYCYFYFSTNTGSTIEYHFEDFFANTPTFNVDGAVSPGGEYKVYPINLKNQATNYDGYAYGISLSGLPLGSWNTDFFNNWKALNFDALQIQNRMEVTQSIFQGANSLLNFDFMNAAATPFAIADQIALAENQIKVAQKLPDQARGDTASQSLTYSLNKSDGTFYTMTIKSEYALIIDDYFSMYGYKVNELKTPNINTRANWNYIKTIGMNLKGDLPQDDIIELKQIFNRGCTFWHNPTNFLNYSADNSII